MGRRKWALVAVLVGVFVLAGAAYAWADPGTGAGAAEGDPLISWMGIKDSYGVPVAKYTLTLNHGNASSPVVTAFANLASMLYELYLCVTATALWLIGWVMDFEWLSLFASPFQTIGAGIGKAMDTYGLAASALAVLAIIAVVTILAQKVAKAVSNIAMGLLMVGLAATVFAHPLAQMIGPDGLLAKGRDTGMEIAANVSGGHNASDTGVLVSSLADRFLRKPTQMINFGVVSDSISRKCEEAWSNGIKNGRDDKLKDDMEDCDAKKGEALHDKAMANPSSILVALGISGLLAGFLIAFACYFVWHVVRTAVHALLYAALAPPAFALGVIPGGPQTFAWKTVLDCLMAYVAMILYVAAFGAYNVVLDTAFARTDNAIKAIFLTALVLAFAFAFFGPLRQMFDRSRDKMAARLGRGSVPGGMGGWSKLQRVADLSRLKSELGRQFGWDDLGRKGSRTRGPASVDMESESSGSGSGGGKGSGQGAPATVADGEGSDPASEPGSAAASGSTTAGSGANPAPKAHAVSYLSGAGASSEHDRLAAAIRLQRRSSGSAGPPRGGGPGGGVRHPLAEVA